MDNSKHQLKIKLDLPGDTAKYYKLQEQWENEGGSTLDKPVTMSLPEIHPPLQTGDYFQVTDGHIDFIGNEIFYIAQIRKVDAGEIKKTVPFPSEKIK